jgi:UDP-GlcNAc:undecaprenyl-phosphate/decaprenyl-phosphate GlcNAc-1-phosphate transferase
MTPQIVSAVAFLAALLAAAAVTPFAAHVATAIGEVSPPRVDRWGSRPTPMFGGIAIVLAVLVPAGILSPDRVQFGILAVGILASLTLGLVDDVRGLRPTSKLVGQIVIGAALAFAGVRVEAITFAPLAFLATLAWVVVIMNAVNLMDNMDGLAAGVVGIGSLVLVLMAPQGGWSAVLAAATTGACLGFLIHNFAPARVYMGDAGSMALGFTLAALTLVLSNEAASNVGLAVFAPLLALGLPIFDTALVTIVRRLEGRPVSQGGRDHTSHRLAALGLSERWTVAVLYVVAAVMAGLGLLAQALGLAFLPLAALGLIALILFGAFLAENPREVARQGELRRATVLGGGRALVRYGGEIALDITLASVALLSAYLIRFESFGPNISLPLFIAAFPIVVPIQLAAFVLLGLYQILWRYVSVIDMLVIARCVSVGTVVGGLVVLVVQRDLGQSRAVFLIDFILLTLLLGGSRMFFASLRQWFGMQGRATGRRVLIVGANETGVMALRLLLRSAEPVYQPAGFLDDDPGKHRRKIGGVPVVGRVADLATLARRERADVVVLALEDDFEREKGVRLLCEELGLELRQLVPPL